MADAKTTLFVVRETVRSRTEDMLKTGKQNKTREKKLLTLGRGRVDPDGGDDSLLQWHTSRRLGVTCVVSPKAGQQDDVRRMGSTLLLFWSGFGGHPVWELELPRPGMAVLQVLRSTP